MSCIFSYILLSLIIFHTQLQNQIDEEQGKTQLFFSHDRYHRRSCHMIPNVKTRSQGTTEKETAM